MVRPIAVVALDGQKEGVWCALGPSRFRLTTEWAEEKTPKTRLSGRSVGRAAGHDVAGPGPARRLVRWLRRGVKCSAVPRHTAAAETQAAARPLQRGQNRVGKGSLRSFKVPKAKWAGLSEVPEVTHHLSVDLF